MTSILSADPRAQDEPEEEEKEAEKKLPGKGTRINTDQFPKGNSSCLLTNLFMVYDDKYRQEKALVLMYFVSGLSLTGFSSLNCIYTFQCNVM